MLNIIEADTDGDIARVRELFLEYWQECGFEPCFQHFDEELAGLPGEYAGPAGCLLLAVVQHDLAGCVAMRPLPAKACEMKRLYVRPTYRDKKVGSRLANHVVGLARQRGYRYMRLDTMPFMQRAVALYRRMGFYEIEPYLDPPTPGATCLELKL